MARLNDWFQRRRERRDARRQEMLERGLEAFEASHSTLIEELKAVGHDPHVLAKWVDDPNLPGRWEFSLACRKCLRRHRGLAPKQLRLLPDFPCEGDGPSLEEWIAESFAGTEVADGKEITVVEVRARTVEEAITSAALQLGVAEEALVVRVADEGNFGRPAVVWARPSPES